MTADSLLLIKQPVILYVRSDLESATFDHYILLLRHNGNHFTCLNNDEVRTVTNAELMSLWSGAGIIVSALPIQSLDVLAPAWLRTAAWGLAAIIFLLAFKWVARYIDARPVLENKFRFRRSLVFQGTGLLMFSILVAAVYQSTAAAGLLLPGNQVQAMQFANSGNFTPRVSEASAYAIFANKFTFVDARHADDFNAGHIKGAISLPVDDDETQFTTAMHGEPFSRPLVVYCQSNTCSFSNIVATKLLQAGYKDVRIYVDGWDGWRDNTSR